MGICPDGSQCIHGLPGGDEYVGDESARFFEKFSSCGH
ncbi:hypothetical protein Mal52_24440 [Symmachiella dynata]|uniref:Uncharacterized protein n=1 Tax=Symmachiella dynata TaxID=2527995 RepID=A0A517ZNC3_9PLAN|nr:hypothetical protein Mal52_24440 [Symmachiella dynata]